MASARSTSKKTKKPNTSDQPLEATLWRAADALRNNMDAAEYKYILLGPIGTSECLGDN